MSRLRRTRSALAFCLLAAAAPVLHATPYVFEARHSQGSLRWTHLGFSHPAAQFSQVDGTMDWNVAAPEKSTVRATIRMADLTTGVPDLDDDFRSPAFFDYAKYPTATFTSTHVEKGAMPNTLKLTGDLALHGVVKPVTLDVTINKVGVNERNHLPSVGFDASGTLKRSDFGLGRFVPQVSDEIRIELTVEAADAAATAKLEAEEAAKEAAEKAAAKPAH